jgi:hypothetical protein
VVAVVVAVVVVAFEVVLAGALQLENARRLKTPTSSLIRLQKKDPDS